MFNIKDTSIYLTLNIIDILLLDNTIVLDRNKISIMFNVKYILNIEGIYLLKYIPSILRILYSTIIPKEYYSTI